MLIDIVITTSAAERRGGRRKGLHRVSDCQRPRRAAAYAAGTAGRRPRQRRPVVPVNPHVVQRPLPSRPQVILHLQFLASNSAAALAAPAPAAAAAAAANASGFGADDATDGPVRKHERRPVAAGGVAGGRGV